MTRTYLIDGKKMTAAEVAALDNPTPDQKRQFFEQAGLPDAQVRTLNAMTDALIPILCDALKESIAPVLQRLKDVEARLLDVQKAGVRYRGVHQRSNGYTTGSIVTHDGSAFVAIKDTQPGEIPGQSDGFQLFVKRGRDAKDAR